MTFLSNTALTNVGNDVSGENPVYLFPK